MSDGKDLLRRLRNLLNEDSDSGWLDEQTSYDFLYDAAIEFVDKTGCVRSSQEITTVAEEDEYNINPDFLRLYLIFPWDIFFLYTGLLFALPSAFLGIAFFISSFVKSSEVALGIAFFIWIALLAFIDIALISLMMQQRMNEELIIFIAMINPMEIFRVAAISLFDPELTVMGPVAFYILDSMSQAAFVFVSIAYPVILGLLFAFFGFVIFKKKDLV